MNIEKNILTRKKIEYTCPYCGHKNREFPTEIDLHYCGNEDCLRAYVSKTDYEFTTSTFKILDDGVDLTKDLYNNSEQEDVRVWIVNEGGHDFKKALRFGEAVSLSRGRMNVFNVDELASSFESKMINYKEGDWLLLCGNNVLSVVASLIVFRKFEHVNVLIYDAIQDDYVPRRIEI